MSAFPDECDQGSQGRDACGDDAHTGLGRTPDCCIDVVPGDVVVGKT